ncbi:MAG: hypothetical protein WAX44_02035 [Minisyncoccia bacterium]
MKKDRKNQTKLAKKQDEWEFFDDCEICQAMKKAKKEGRELGKKELEFAFHHQNSKTKQKEEKLMYVFEVRLLENEKIMRAIVMPGDFSLYELADLILNAFEFDFGHAFGFFDKVTEGFYYNSARSYELFADLIEEGQDLEPTGSGSVKKTKISSVWGKPGEEMMFMFDYGDDWRFRVKLMGQMLSRDIGEPEILGMEGKAPKQYR